MHLLDVGEQEYGDSVLCDFGGTRVLIDGAHPGDQVGTQGHPSIPEQIQSLLSTTDPPVHLDLLIVTHTHQDHIGCLPYLVEHQFIEADWALVADPGLGWGRALGDDRTPPADTRVANLAAALREEIRSQQTDDLVLAQFIADAVSLEQQYNAMLKTLGERGTRVVRYGRDDAGPLLDSFGGIGLKLLGPSQAQLVACAEQIAKTSADAVVYLSDLVQTADAPVLETEVYRALVSGDTDAVDAVSRPGPAINLQSIVTMFEYGDLKLLLAGDMQFANPQVGHPNIRPEVEALRKTIKEEAPFGLVKLSHHGSDNALDDQVLSELGSTALFGICAGEESRSHPNPAVLRLLNQERDRLEWVRTDRNGLASLEFNQTPQISLTRGEVSDPRPNSSDQEALSSQQEASSMPSELGSQPVVEVEAGSGIGSTGDGVEIAIRIPAGIERLSFSVDLRSGAPPQLPPQPASDPLGQVTIAAGRQLPQLLFVTSASRLAANIGELEAQQVLDAIRGAGHQLYDQLPDDATDPAGAQALVREQLRARSTLEGVVLLGGYDVVPSQRIDALPPPLRQALGGNGDADNFIVWSDDSYGDRDGDLIADIPVSRVPDGKSAAFLVAALAAGGGPRTQPRVGVRNIARPFADEVFAALPGPATLAISEPIIPTGAPQLNGDLTYLMLHGDFADSSRFWGEDSAGRALEAVNLNNIPSPASRVVFTGCCWGALTVDQPALKALPNVTPAVKVADASMALTFLANGATAYIGCTGSHYSPTDQPYQYFGGPMHEAYWRRLLGGDPPAGALFKAKIDYIDGFPHGLTSEVEHAIEYKILRQYTCLGLGW